MFQQNGRRTRGSSAPSTAEGGLSRIHNPTPSHPLFAERGSVRKGGGEERGRETERDTERPRWKKGKEKEKEGARERERKRKREKETGSVHGRRFKGNRGERGGWRSTTTLGNQRPPLATLVPSLR